MGEELYHYGTPRHSGRYPWGSGENPYQSDPGHFMSALNKMKKDGLNDKQIAEAMGISTTVLRARRSVAKDEYRAAQASQALRLKDKGYSNVKIAELMGLPNESSVRSLLDPAIQNRASATKKVADTLKDSVSERKYIDIGKGAEAYLGVSQTKLNTAVNLMKDQGYKVYELKVDQLGTGYKTTIKVLCSPDTEFKDLVANRDKISPVTGFQFKDNGATVLGIKPPVGVDPKRVGVRYGDEGGKDMDGVIQLRRGVDDISLGNSRYAQVRIKVGEDRYLKGMAMYSDDLPDGVDLMFNTNKTRAQAKKKAEEDGISPEMAVMKGVKKDEDNPFGATVSQREYVGKDGKKHLSAINIVNEEGNWGDWKKSLASQMLSKQPVELAKKQLTLDYETKRAEYDEIMSLTNPVIKKKLLQSYSDDCDASAVHLKAAGLPRMASHVILPFPKMKENEIYAPNYRDGETVVLIRYPHGGKFEIPTLRVNNKFPEAKSVLGNAKDAVGINSKVAEQLSGADFDGDTVLVIPNRSGAIKTSKPLAGLKDFDPKDYYPAYEGMKKVGPKTDGFYKQREMGVISNLITDMTIKSASQDEIARAVRHSMVVIDAEKHNLNWKQSYVDNGIASLKEKYQGSSRGGASTIISRSKSEVHVPQRQIGYRIDKETGEKIYKETGEKYRDRKTGKMLLRRTETTRMAEAKDAYELIDGEGTPIERVYADYANKMKALGNRARKSAVETGSMKYDPSAKKVYSEEVSVLKSKLNVALKHAPMERQAQLQANIVIAAKRKDNPDMDKEELSRAKSQALTAARARLGVSKKDVQISITPREWEAIQAGAISNNMLLQILNNTDLDKVREYATPRQTGKVSASQASRAKAMLDSGFTQAEVAEQLGISVSTLRKAIK